MAQVVDKMGITTNTSEAVKSRLMNVEKRIETVETFIDDENIVYFQKCPPDNESNDYVLDQAEEFQSVQNVELPQIDTESPPTTSVVFDQLVEVESALDIEHVQQDSELSPTTSVFDQLEEVESVQNFEHLQQDTEFSPTTAGVYTEPSAIPTISLRNITDDSAGNDSPDNVMSASSHPHTRDVGTNTWGSIYEPIPTRITYSRSDRPRSWADPDYEGFYEPRRRRTKHFCVLGFRHTLSAEWLKRRVSDEGPTVKQVRIFPMRSSKYRVVVRLSVESDTYTDNLLDGDFWPWGITCQPWHSRSRDTRRRHTSRYRSHEPSQGRDQPDVTNHFYDDYNPYSALSDMD